MLQVCAKFPQFHCPCKKHCLFSLNPCAALDLLFFFQEFNGDVRELCGNHVPCCCDGGVHARGYRHGVRGRRRDA